MCVKPRNEYKVQAKMMEARDAMRARHAWDIYILLLHFHCNQHNVAERLSKED
jgi:hypothetical protein